MFETQYNELALAVDLVAERIRALGVKAPGTYKQFAGSPRSRRNDGVPKADDIIRRLVEGHETVSRTAREVFHAADGVSDQPTCDLLRSACSCTRRPRGCWGASSSSSQTGGALPR